MSKTRAGLDAMDRVLASAEFSRSGRLSSFLRYVCTATLADNSVRLTEQHIGVEVFGRPPHYLPADDTIVRTTAGLLRKRLAKYYENEGSADPVRIAIPRGSYVPVFAPACADPAAADRSAAVEAEPENAPPPAPVDDGPPAPARPTSRPRFTLPAWWRARGRLRNLVCALAAGAGVLAFTVSGAFSPGAARDPVELFWASLFSQQHETILVPADSELVMYQTAARREVGLDDYIAKRFPAPADGGAPFQWRRYTATTSVTLAAELGKMSAAAPRQFRVRYARDLQLTDLKHASVILVGIQQANPWVRLFRKRLNYHIDWDPAADKLLVRNDKPAAGEQALYEFVGADHPTRGFAVIAYTRNLSGNGHALMIGGTSSAGTEAAIEFLLSPERMRDVLRRAVNADGAVGTFEVMLQCELQATGSTDVKLLGVRADPI
ncbi:hypothetical protein [Burkholderia sp. LMU1-1-1.1]|uniref:hypothetical protein n=1 Tax=Burkholderia sp. LMU1-1-1.1 TaxID=3135266 RepID=UPI003447B835